MSQAHALAGRVGGLTTAARHGGRKAAAPALKGFMAKFEREVDPDSRLTPEERKRRAEAARRAHMARLAIKSAQARRKSSTTAQSASSSAGADAPAGAGGAGRGAVETTGPSSVDETPTPAAPSAAPHRENQPAAVKATGRSERAAVSAQTGA